MTHQRTPCRDCRTVIDEGVRCAPCQARREAMIARGQAGTRTWASPEHHPAAMPDGWDILDVRRAEVELAKNRAELAAPLRLMDYLKAVGEEIERVAAIGPRRPSSEGPIGAPAHETPWAFYDRGFHHAKLVVSGVVRGPW